MLGLFRINDPYRLAILLIFLFLIALPIWVSDSILTQPELHWMIVGERLGEGVLLYVNLWDETGPLAALVYGFIDIIFGRSVLSYRIMGLIIFFIQAAYFNISLLRHKILTEYNYVPSLVYAILGMLVFNQITLSPALMGLSFILPAFDNLFFHLQARKRFDAQLVNIGILTGIASLFYIPFVYFMIIWVIALLVYSTTIYRRYFLMFYGFIFIFFILWIFYVWKGQADKLYIDYFFSLFRRAPSRYMDFYPMLIFMVVPAFVFFINLFIVYKQPGYTNYQSRIQSFFLLTFLALSPVWLIYCDHSGNNLILFIPGMAFFITQGFILIKKRWKRELFFYFFVISILAINYGTFFNFADLKDKTGLYNVMTKEVNCTVPIEGKRILVVGDNINYYAHSHQATPYFNWRLSKLQLDRLNYYDNLVDIYRNFEKDMPEVIIDLNGVMGNVFEKIPLLERRYLLVDEKGVYVLN